MLNLGGLFFTLDADTRGLTNAQRRIERFAGEVRSAFRGLEKGTVSSSFANGLLRQEKAAIGMLERIKRLQDQVGNASGKGSMGLTGATWQKARVELEKLTNTYDNFSRKMNSGVKLNNLDYSRRIMHMTAATNDATRAIKNLQQSAGNRTPWGNAVGGLHQFGSAALVVQGHFGGLSTRLFAFGNLMDAIGFKGALLASAFAGMTASIALLGTGMVKSGMELERITVAMEGVAGSSIAAGVELAYVRQIADQAGISFADAAKGFTRYLAAAEGVISHDDIQQTFTEIALSASKMQLSVEDTQGVFRALEQIMSKGTVQAEELRGQLGDRLPGAFKIAAAAMGVTTRELGKMMKEGDVISSEFLPKFSAMVAKVYGVDTSKNVDTLQASLNRLNNEWTYFLQDMNNSLGVSKAFKNAMDGITDALQGIRVNLPDIITGVGTLAGALAGLAAAWAVGTVVTWMSAMGGAVAIIGRLAVALRSAAAAQALFNTLAAGNVYVKIIQLVLTLAGAYMGAKLAQDLLTGSAADYQKASAATLDDIQEQIKLYKELGFQVRSVTSAMLQKMRVMQQETLSQQAKDLADLSAANQRLARYMRTGDPAAFKADINRTKTEIRDLTAKINGSTAAVRRMTGALKDVRTNVATLPTAMPTAMVGDIGGTDTADTAKKVKEEISETQRAYEQFVDMLESEARKAESVQKKFAFLASGGNFRDLKLFDDLFDAGEALKDFDPKSQEGLAALQKIQDKLASLGFVADNTKGVLQGTTEALAQYYNVTTNNADVVKQFTKLKEVIEDAKWELAELKSLTIASGVGGGTSIFSGMEDGAAVVRETQRALERARKVNDRQKELRARGEMQVTINKELENYLNILRQIDEQEDVMNRTARAAQMNRDAFRSMVNDGLTGIKDLITGVKNLGDALMDLASSFLDTLWQRYIIGPANNFLDDLAMSSAKRQTASVDTTAVGRFAANDNGAATAQVTALGNAAATAAQQVGGGLVSSATALATQLITGVTADATAAAAASAKGAADTVAASQVTQLAISLTILKVAADQAASAMMAMAISGSISSAVGGAAGRAFGGPVNAGQVYRINEPGVMGEYFMSGSDGHISRTSANDSGGGGVYIDARTTIDARGASKDAVALLRAEMAQRDASLRKELPYMVDTRVRESSSRGRYG